MDQDEVDWVWEMIADHQINFLTAWERVHGGEWKTGPEPMMMKLEAKQKTEYRLRLKPKVKKDSIKEALGGIHDKRFLSLQKRLIWDLDRAEFRSVDLVLYMRLGGWSHTGGTYSNTMVEVEALCEAMFGYALPEKIGKFFMKKYRYVSGKALVGVWAAVTRYHEGRLHR